MKISFVSLVLLVVAVALRDDVDALYADEYVLSIGELSLNATFLLEFEKRTLALFADPTYLHGIRANPFPCPVQLDAVRLPSSPLDVHHLAPQHIQCVAAIGDSLTAALGAHAGTPIGLVTEYRGETTDRTTTPSVPFVQARRGRWAATTPSKRESPCRTSCASSTRN